MSSPARRSVPARTALCWPTSRPRSASSTRDAATKARLLDAGKAALIDDVRPAYRRVIALMQAQQKAAGTDDGIWRFPNGAAQYQALLKFYTTSRPDPRPGPRARAGAGRAHPRRDERDQGPGRLQGHAAGILRAHARRASNIYYPNDAAGRQRYLDETDKALKQTMAASAALFRPHAQVAAAGASRSSRSARRSPARPSTRTRRPTVRGPGPITSTSTT